MAIWGAVAKIGAGMLKGRAKKQTGAEVATKVMGKKESVYKAKANPNATSSELDAKKIVPVAASTENISKSQGSRTTSLKESALRIKTTTIEVNTLLRGSLVLDKMRAKNRKETREELKRTKAEKDLEKDNKGKFSLPIPGAKTVKSFWERIKNFFLTMFWGMIGLKLMPLLPHLLKALPWIAKTADWLINFAVGFVDVLGSAIKLGYDVYDWARMKVKDTFGEDALKGFDDFMEKMSLVVNGTVAIAVGFGLMAAKGALMTWGSKLLGLGTKTATTAATTTTTATSVATTAGGIGAGAAAGIVAGVGLLASGLGEGSFQIKKKGQEAEADWFRRYKEKKWWDPRKAVDWGILQIMKAFNFITGTIGVALDIIGTPFRYLIELVRYPFLDEAGKKKQRENLAKFDARIREQFREVVNAFSLGLLAKDKGAFGSLYGSQGTDAMGYTKEGKTKSRQEAIKKGKILLSTPDLISTQDLLKGKQSVERVHTIERIITDSESKVAPLGGSKKAEVGEKTNDSKVAPLGESTPQENKLKTANQQGGAQAVIDSISTTASYEEDGKEIIVVDQGASTQQEVPTTTKKKVGSSVSVGSGGGSDPYEGLYKGS